MKELNHVVIEIRVFGHSTKSKLKILYFQEVFGKTYRIFFQAHELFLNLSESFSVGFSKLHSTCPVEPCGYKNLYMFTPNWQITEKEVYILRE